MSAQTVWIVVRFSGLRFIVTTRKTAARVSGPATSWGSALAFSVALGFDICEERSSAPRVVRVWREAGATRIATEADDGSGFELGRRGVKVPRWRFRPVSPEPKGHT